MNGRREEKVIVSLIEFEKSASTCDCIINTLRDEINNTILRLCPSMTIGIVTGFKEW